MSFTLRCDFKVLLNLLQLVDVEKIFLFKSSKFFVENVRICKEKTIFVIIIA